MLLFILKKALFYYLYFEGFISRSFEKSKYFVCEIKVYCGNVNEKQNTSGGFDEHDVQIVLRNAKSEE